MSTSTKNLGQVAAMSIGTTAPTNTTLIWYDTNPGVNKQKYYNVLTSTWEFYGSGFTIISITRLALIALRNAGTLTPGYYRVTDSTLADGGIILKANSTKSLDNSGVGIFLNADYQSVGTYPSGLFTQLGVWYSGLTPSLFTEVCIWNGRHWVYSGGGNTEPGVGSDWTAYDKEDQIAGSNLGYIQETDFVVYNIDTDEVLYRQDKRGNKIGDTFAAVGNFQWGCDSTIHNVVSGDSTLLCINNRGNVIGNEIKTGGVNVIRNIGTVEKNTIIGVSTIESPDNSGGINYNIISANSQLIATGNIGFITSNDLLESSVTVNCTGEGTVTGNRMTKSTVNLAGCAGNFDSNILHSATVESPDLNAGCQVRKNKIEAGASVDFTNCSVIIQNNVISGLNSSLNASSNLGTIQDNVIDSGSVLSVSSNQGNISYNRLLASADISLAENNSGDMLSNIIQNSGSLVIDNTAAASFSFNNINLGDSFALTIDLTGGFNFTKNSIHVDQTMTITLTENTVSRVYNSSVSNFRTIIAASGSTFDLTTGNKHVGMVRIDGGGTETINLFANFPINHPVQFRPTLGVEVTFTHATGANQPICSGGVDVVIDGDNGDWVEFTRKETYEGSGVYRIYQTGGETY